MKVPKCPKCKKDGEWVDNIEVYGRRYGKSYMCYYCRDCDTYVGCHNNTRNPLGEMADKETREARKKAHEVIDPLWRSGRYSRKLVYERLSEAFGHDVHIAQADKDYCEEVIKTANLIFKELEQGL